MGELLVIPIVLPIAGGLLSALTGRVYRPSGAWVAFATLLLTLSFGAWLGIGSGAADLPLRMPGLTLGVLALFTLYADHLAIFFLVLLPALAVPVVLSSVRTTEEDGNGQNGTYHLFLLVGIGAINGAVLAWEVPGLYVFLLASSLCLAILMAAESDGEGAGRFFWMVEGMGLLLFAGLWGAALLGRGELAEFEDMAQWLAYPVLAGAAARLAIVPLHTWLTGASSSMSWATLAIVGAVVPTMGVYLMLRLWPQINQQPTNILPLLGSLTIMLGAYAALHQPDLRRLLAFYLVGQTGYAALAAGLATPLGAQAALFQVIAQGFVLVLLSVALGVAWKKKATDEAGGVVAQSRGDGAISNSEQLFEGKKPDSSVLLAGVAVALVAGAGLPPFPGFTSHVLVVEALLSGKAPAFALPAALLGIALTAFCFSGLAKVQVARFKAQGARGKEQGTADGRQGAATEGLEAKVRDDESGNLPRASRAVSAAIVVVGLVSIALGLAPSLWVSTFARPAAIAMLPVPRFPGPGFGVQVVAGLLVLLALAVGGGLYLLEARSQKLEARGQTTETRRPTASRFGPLTSVLSLLASSLSLLTSGLCPLEPRASRWWRWVERLDVVEGVRLVGWGAIRVFSIGCNAVLGKLVK